MAAAHTLVLEKESRCSRARADGLPGGHTLHVGRAWGSPGAHPVGMLPFQEEKGGGSQRREARGSSEGHQPGCAGQPATAASAQRLQGCRRLGSGRDSSETLGTWAPPSFRSAPLDFLHQEGSPQPGNRPREPRWSPPTSLVRMVRMAPPGASLAVQWLRLGASTAGGAGSVPDLRARVLRSAAKKKKEWLHLHRPSQPRPEWRHCGHSGPPGCPRGASRKGEAGRVVGRHSPCPHPANPAHSWRLARRLLACP